MLIRCSLSMIYGTFCDTPSLNRSSKPTGCTEQVETFRTVLLRFDAPASPYWRSLPFTVGSHSAAACTALFDHSDMIEI